MRLIQLLFAILAISCVCLVRAQEEEIAEDEFEVTEPPRFLIRPRRPLKINRSTSKPSAVDDSDIEKNQTSITSTTKPVTKRPSRSRSKTTTAKVTSIDKNANVTATATKRPSNSKSRNRSNRNRNRNSNRSKSRSRTTAQLSDEEGISSTSATTKNGRRRGNTGRRTTTPKTVVEEITKSRTTKSRASSNRKRTTTPKPTTQSVTEEVLELKTRKPAVKSQRFQPRPLPIIKNPSSISSNIVGTTPSSIHITLPQAEIKPLTTKRVEDDEQFEEIPLKRPVSSLPMEGAIIDEEPLKSFSARPLPSDRFRWEPIETPQKFDASTKKPKEMLKEEQKEPIEDEEEEATTPSPIVQNKLRPFRPILSRTSPPSLPSVTKPSDSEDEEELNSFSKPVDKSSSSAPVGVPPKPIGPVSFRPRPKKLPEKETAGDNKFKSSKSTSPRPSRLKPSTKQAFVPSSSRTPKAIKINDKIENGPLDKNQNIDDDEEDFITTSHARTPYPLRLDDGTYLGKPNMKAKRPSAIFSPFEEDDLEEEKPLKPTESVFKLRDDRRSFRVKPSSDDNLFESRTTKPIPRNQHTTFRSRNSHPTVVPSTFRPSKLIVTSTPINQERSPPKVRAKPKIVDEEAEDIEITQKDDKMMRDSKMTRGHKMSKDSSMTSGKKMKNEKMMTDEKTMTDEKMTTDEKMMTDEEMTTDDENMRTDGKKMKDEKMMTDKEMTTDDENMRTDGKKMKDEKMMKEAKPMKSEEKMKDEMMMTDDRRSNSKDGLIDDGFNSPISVPPRSRYLNFTKIPSADEAPPIREDPFSVPTPDIGRIPTEDDELLVPAIRKENIPALYEGPLVPALPRRQNVGILTLEPITPRFNFGDDDFDSLDLPSTRKLPSLKPAVTTTLPSVSISNAKQIAPMQVGIESPFFVIRKPVNQSASEMAKPPTARSRNPIILDEGNQNPKTLAAALPSVDRKSAPASDLPVDERSTKNMNLKSRVVSTMAPIVELPSQADIFDDAEEYEEYDDEV